MIVLDCYCILTCTKRLYSFLCLLALHVSNNIQKFLNVNGNLKFVFFRYVIVLYSYFCHFACSPSCLLFHEHSLIMYKGPISVLKKGGFLG